MNSNRWLGILLVILATAFWSTSGIFIHLVSQGSGVTPVGLAFWRDLGTFTVLFLGMLILRPDLFRVKRGDLPWLAAMGVLSIGLFHVMWNMNVLINGASVATVIQCNAPIFVTIMGWMIWGEPLTGRKIAAVGLAAFGTILIARLDNLDGAHITLLGLVVGLVAAIAYGGFSLFGKKLSSSYSAWTILLYVFGFATLALLPFQLNSPIPWPMELTVLRDYAALVLLTTIAGFGLYTTALRQLQASVAAITANTEVPFAAILAYFVLNERLDGWQILGAVLVVVAVILVSLPRRSRLLKINLKTAPTDIRTEIHGEEGIPYD
jgi:drug/metabolite transporter (DMT)-like permease